MPEEKQPPEPPEPHDAVDALLEDYGAGHSLDMAIREEIKNTTLELEETYSRQLIEDLSAPPEAPAPGTRGLTPVQALIAFNVANGVPIVAIAAETGISKSSITNWIKKNEPFKKRVYEIQSKLGLATVAKKFEAISERATEIAQGLMEDPEVNPSTRLQAAIMFIEQTRGKAPQKVEHKDSLLQSLLSRLDSDTEKAAIERFVSRGPYTSLDDEPEHRN